jgi:hypothetical protein
MNPKVPLKKQQIIAANRLNRANLHQWQVTDRALDLLSNSVPGFSWEACLLKATAVNTLYSARVLPIKRMAKHIHQLLGRSDTKRLDRSIVEVIAALPDASGVVKRSYTSFASKFCHFFIDSDRFPIYDDAARRMVERHLGRNRIKNREKAHPYAAFCSRLDTLRASCGIVCSTRELDRYLWVVGMWIRFRQDRKDVNSDLKILFVDHDRKPNQDLQIALNVFSDFRHKKKRRRPKAATRLREKQKRN